MKKRILIIDDDMDFVGILRHNLEKRDYDVLTANNGREGLEKARTDKPDLVILDIMLPEADGYKVSRFLKFDMKYKNIPIIIFSSRRDGAELSAKVGADAYIVKSADAEELFEKIESFLGEGPSGILNVKTEYPPLPFSEKAEELKYATIDDLKTRLARLVKVDEAIYDVNRYLEIDACIKNLIEKVSTILTAEVSSVMLLDKKEHELVLKLAKGIKEEIVKKVKTKLGEGIAGWVAKEAKPLLVEDVRDYPQFKKKEERSYKTSSFMSVPLIVDNEVLGVLNVTDKIDGTKFTKEDLDTLVAIVNHASVTIKNSTLYEELKRLNTVKSDFIATLSHELKNPLINVSASIDLLLGQPQAVLNEEEKKFLLVARNNIERLMRLIDDLLDISRLESGKMTMRRDRIDISGLIKGVADSFKAAFEKKHINFRMKLPSGEKTIWGDADRLEQVLDNLVGNAVKFAPEHGKVSITLEEAGTNIRLIISDNGPGIPREDIPKIFDKFSSLSIHKDNIRKSAGLGLSITKDIVGMHKGSIWVESEVGNGSNFFVVLPKDLRSR